MDMSIGMKVPSGAICTLSLSFNNDGPLGTFFAASATTGRGIGAAGSWSRVSKHPTHGSLIF
jgi:hypothetical protein